VTPQDITVQLNQYSCLYMYTDKVAMLYEDNIPDACKKEAGERMGLVREMVRYGALKGCTNKFYSGGTSRATVDEPLSKNILSKVTRSIMANRGKMVTQVLSAGPNYGTTPVEAAMLVFAHTDMEYDIREIPGFRETAGYAQRKIVHEMELGSVDRYRFVVSPELSSIIDAGAAVGATGCVSTGAANIDVYPAIVVADDAWGDVALRGSNSFSVSHIPHGQRDKSDPLGQRGYIGCIFWSAAFIQNDGWMAVIEAGVTDLG
jgi:N4-gp56 family major capsid protein